MSLQTLWLVASLFFIGPYWVAARGRWPLTLSLVLLKGFFFFMPLLPSSAHRGIIGSLYMYKEHEVDLFSMKKCPEITCVMIWCFINKNLIEFKVVCRSSSQNRISRLEAGGFILVFFVFSYATQTLILKWQFGAREEIQPGDCFDIVGQSPGKPLCSSATEGGPRGGGSGFRAVGSSPKTPHLITVLKQLEELRTSVAPHSFGSNPNRLIHSI